MFCSNCGNKNEEGIRFCQKCGTLLNFVPGQNVPHNFKPYSLEEKKTQEMKALRALSDPFADDELPEEKPPVMPTVDPFGNPLPVARTVAAPALDPFGNPLPVENQDENSSSHWGVRITMIILLVGMLTVTLVRPGNHFSGVNIMDTLYNSIKMVSHMNDSDLAAWITSMLFFNGLILFVLLAFINLLSKPYRITATLVFIFLLSFCGIGACVQYKLEAGYPIGFFVVSIVCDILNRKLAKKKKTVKDDIVIPDDDVPNPLL